MARTSLSLFQGTLDMLLLRALALGPRHGYALAKWIRETTEGDLEIEEGALYTALHRMEKHGWLEADWGTSETGRRAKYYELTREGRGRLESETRTWRRYADAVFKVIQATEAAAAT